MINLCQIVELVGEYYSRLNNLFFHNKEQYYIFASFTILYLKIVILTFFYEPIINIEIDI